LRLQSSRAQALMLFAALTPEARHLFKQRNPPQPFYVFAASEVMSTFPELSEADIVQLSTPEIVSKVDILVKTLSKQFGANSMRSHCGGDNTVIGKIQGKAFYQEAFFVVQVGCTLEEISMLANSVEVPGGRERVEEVKLRATIKAYERHGEHCLVLAKDGDGIVAKFGSIREATEIFHLSWGTITKAKMSKVGGLDVSGINFTMFTRNRTEFIAISMPFDHKE
jgi:hypothetical protein